jgi:multicomponent Na+:H+ antiporter subunit B
MLNILTKGLAVILLPISVTFAVYIHCFGESSPGGGFQAGLLLATSFILIHSSFDVNVISKKVNLLTLCLASITYLTLGTAGLIVTGDFLNFNLFKSLCSGDCVILSQKISIFIAETCILLVVSTSVLQIYFCLTDANKLELS